ncbi:MAG: HTH domain-containing protein [Bacteroidota bacterium]
MTLYDRIRLVQRIDRLIRLKSAGTPKEFATKLNISRSTLYRLLEELKEFGAPIRYCRRNQHFYYEKDFVLNFDRLRI